MGARTLVTTSKNSERMRGIRRQDTAPEMRLRSTLHASGLRYRLHRKQLPGTPDIAFVAQKVAVFVHGCFWHAHAGCAKATVPKSNTDFWVRKLEQNRSRDEAVRERLEGLGWRVLAIWQCELDRDIKEAANRIKVIIKQRSRHRCD